MIDSAFAFEVILILALIVLNGVFAMSEIAVVSSRTSRLRQRADSGDAGARRALQLAEHPTRFLSTVQIGITAVGVFAGAYGGASIAGRFDASLESIPLIAPYSEEIALAIVVAAITFLSLVIGELVPKRIALNHPETIASRVAGPMQTLSRVATPVVRVLSISTEFFLRLLRIRAPDEPPVTEEEIAALIDAGTEAGVFETEEHDLVDRVFWLGDQRVSALMTPRHRIDWIDVTEPIEAQREELVKHRYSHFLLCERDVDTVIGVVRVKDLLARLLRGEPLDLPTVSRKPLFVPEALRALRLLEMFRESGVRIAVVVDEFGGVEGLVTLDDVLMELTGDVDVGDPSVVERPDGSWLVDGSITMDQFWDGIGMEERREEERRDYNTLGGMIVTELGRIPRSGVTLETLGLRFEVVDMDGHRIDKVLVSHQSSDSTTLEMD